MPTDSDLAPDAHRSQAAAVVHFERWFLDILSKKKVKRWILVLVRSRYLRPRP